LLHELLHVSIAFLVLAVPIHLLQTVWNTHNSPLLVWFLLAASAAWAVYLGALGVRLMNTPAPIGTLGRQYITVAAGRVLATVLLGMMAALGMPY
jgi:hypothetical protein